MKGTIGLRAGERAYQLVVEDPTAFCAGAFRRALQARGITIDGTTTFAATPSSAVKVTGLSSPPIGQMLDVMNGESINHYAELLFRDAGRNASPSSVGSVETANNLLQSFMTTKVGAAPGAVFAADGSGLSVLDKITPRALVQLLSYANNAPWKDAFHTSLPIAGQSELLRHRMRATPAQGNLHAKTGTTNSVISARRLRDREERRDARLRVHLQRRRPMEREVHDRRDGRDAGIVRAVSANGLQIRQPRVSTGHSASTTPRSSPPRTAT